METRNFRILIAGAFLVLGFWGSHKAFAAPILQDSFTDLSKVNQSVTTSIVDTSKQEVRLSGLADNLATYAGDQTPAYIVPTSSGISWLGYDQSSNSMKVVNSYSVTGVTALGVAVRQDSPSIWAIVDNGSSNQSVVQYDYNDSTGQMSANPYLTVTGLSNVLSITAQPTSNEVATLTTSGSGTGVVTTYMQDASTNQLVQVPIRSFDTGLTNPLSISFMPDTPDVVVKTASGVYYYLFDSSSNTYKQNPLFTVTDTYTAQVTSSSVSADNANILVNTSSQPGALYKLNDSTGGYSQAPTNFNGASGNASSVSLLQGSDGTEMAMLYPDGSIHFFALDQAGTGMSYQDVSMLGSTGIITPRLYVPSSTYQSVTITTANPVEQLKLTDTESNDANTMISYYVTTDGGSTWKSITPGTWLSVTPGNQVAVKAIESTSDGLGTPRIKFIQLDGAWLSISNLTATRLYWPGPDQQNATPTTTFPVYIRSGGQVEFQVQTTGFAQSVTAQFTDNTSMNLTPQNPITSETNTWVGWYSSNMNQPDGSSVGMTLTATNGTLTKTLTKDPLLIINNSVTSLMNVRITD